jgi:hypothetical protein
MKKILLFALMTFFVQTSFCQNLSDTVNVEYSKNSPRRFSLSVGPLTSALAWHSMPNLNQILETQRISNSGFDNVSIYLPAGLSYQNNRFLLRYGLGFGIAMSNSDRMNNYSTSLNVRNFNLSTGYALFADRNHFLYLNLGIGYGEYTKTINKFSSQSTSLATALQNGAGQSIILKNSQGFVDISIEFLNRSQGKRIGQSIRLGYRYGLKETPWASEFIHLSDVPSDRMGSIYLEGLLNIPNFSRRERNNPSKN